MGVGCKKQTKPNNNKAENKRLCIFIKTYITNNYF